MAKLQGSYAAFLDDYRRQRPFYERLASFASRLVGGRLSSRGIRALVTDRAKSSDRLRGKLENLAAEYPAMARDEIRTRVYDLAGIRVALYFPGDLATAREQIESLVDVKQSKEFPGGHPNKYNKFPGYCATHFIATLKPPELEQLGTEFKGELFEIQVASVFMHAWSEVEHDLRYKPLTGPISDDEESILESLNGLALAAETQLRQLQRAISRRTKRSDGDIRNHYELAALLTSLARQDESSRLPMGRADVLFYLLSELKMLSPAAVQRLFESTNWTNDDRSIVDGVIEKLIDEDPSRTAALTAARQQAGESNPYDPRSYPANEDVAGELRFLRLWQLADKAMAQITGERSPVRARQSLKALLPQSLAEEKVADLEDELGHLDYTRKIRNDFVHEGLVIDQNVLQSESALLVSVIEKLTELLPTAERRKTNTALRMLKADVSPSQQTDTLK